MAPVIGYGLLLVSLCWIAYRMRDSYTSAGGTVDVVTRDAAIYPPILIGVGLYLVLPGWGLEWPWWGYVLVALALIPIVLGVNYWMMILGDKEL